MAAKTFTALLTATTINNADDLLELTAANNTPIEIVRIWASTYSQVLGTQQERLRFVELSAAGSGGGAGTAVGHDLGVASNTTVATAVPNATRGTVNNTILLQAFDVTSGFLWIASPSERIFVPVQGKVSLGFPAITNGGNNWVAGITWIEYS